MKAQPIVNVPLDQVRILNPRTRAKRQHQAIVDSIAAVGLKRPITVSRRAGKASDPPYDLVCGQGRMEAVRLLGHTGIPAIVVNEDESECLVRSLVENVARRNHTTQESLRDIEQLRKGDYGDDDIALKTGLSVSYVRDVLLLLGQGEDRLLEAVEHGTVPMRLALVIARCGSADVQRALADAYADGTLKGKQLLVVRRLIQRRVSAGRALQASGASASPKAKRLTPEVLKKMYVQESARQRMLVKRADVTRTKLAVLVEILRDLMSDADFIELLRREHLSSLPRALDQRIRREVT
jgi:ParB family chromosome partitioning protein